MHLQESGEMYLESIFVLLRKCERVRSLDVAEHMGFSKPSVSRAMALLKKENYILVDKNGYIALTLKGYEIAEKIYERHTVLTELLTQIGVSPETAAADACKIEHAISDETFGALKRSHAKFMEK